MHVNTVKVYMFYVALRAFLSTLLHRKLNWKEEEHEYN